MSVYMALIFGTIYLHLITLPLLFGPGSFYGLFSYRWQHGVRGLAYLDAGLGNILGTFVYARYLNRSYVYLNERQKRKSGTEDSHAESRMFFLQIGMAVVPCGLIIFAWTAQTHQHWVLPLLGGALSTVGVLMAYVCIQTYLVDVYGQYSASALAAMVASRSIGSCILSIVGFQLHVKLEYGWGTMVVAFLCIAALPVPMFIYKFGPSLRAKDAKRFSDV